MTSELTTIGRLRRFFVRMFGFQEVYPIVGPRCPRCFSPFPSYVSGRGDTDLEWRCRRCGHPFVGDSGPRREEPAARCPECLSPVVSHNVNGHCWQCDRCGHGWDGETLDLEDIFPADEIPEIIASARKDKDSDLSNRDGLVRSGE